MCRIWNGILISQPLPWKQEKSHPASSERGETPRNTASFLFPLSAMFLSLSLSAWQMAQSLRPRRLASEGGQIRVRKISRGFQKKGEMCNLVPRERNFTQPPLSHFPAPRTVTASPAVRRPQAERNIKGEQTIDGRPRALAGPARYGIGWHHVGEFQPHALKSK